MGRGLHGYLEVNFEPQHLTGSVRASWVVRKPLKQSFVIWGVSSCFSVLICEVEELVR
jgi:hypothetical protein